MIYFMQPVDGGPIKIGYSQNVEARHKQLESYYGKTLVVLAIMDGDYEEEQEWHQRFAHLRYPGTEQFKPAIELLEAIGKPEIVSANPDSVEVMRSRCDDFMAVKIERAIVEKAKYIAARRRITLAQYLSDITRDQVYSDFEKELVNTNPK